MAANSSAQFSRRDIGLAKVGVESSNLFARSNFFNSYNELSSCRFGG